MDQTLPQNFMVIVDTKVESASAFNAALNMISSLHHERAKPHKLFIVHMSNIKQNYFTGKEKKQENLSKQERCCKCVLSYYGKRAEIFEIPYMLIGCYCNDRSEYDSKISFLVDRFEITGIFIGNLKFHLPVDIRANVMHINRVMGFIPDKAYLKDTIHGEDISNFKSLEETRGREGSTHKSKLGSDFMEYRWTDIPRFADVEKALLQNEILGVGYPHELPRAEPKIDVKLEPIATKPESSNIKAEQVEEEEDEEERPEIEERPKSVVTPLEVTREKEPVGQGQTLPPPISARDQEYERVQPRGIDEMQAQEPRQISAGQTTIATGESGTAAISSQPAGMPVPQSLEEMEKDLDAMEEQLRKLNMGGDVDQQQKSAIV